jgi:hypothetical protein
MYCSKDNIGAPGDDVMVMVNDHFSTATTERCLDGKLFRLVITVVGSMALGYAAFRR